MRELFSEYYKPTEQETNRLWQDATIVFDANVLLNIYSYSTETRNIALNVLERIKDRLWLPHQFALEYQERRFNRISDEIDNIDKSAKQIDNLLSNNIKAHRKHPFLSEKRIMQLEEM